MRSKKAVSNGKNHYVSMKTGFWLTSFLATHLISIQFEPF